jgi:hypothetical protein
MRYFLTIVAAIVFAGVSFCVYENVNAQIFRRQQQVICGPNGCVVQPQRQPIFQPIRQTILPAPRPTVVPTSAPVEVAIDGVEASDSFHRSIISAAVSAQRKGEINRRDLIRIRVAMLAPAFRQSAQDLAVTQMVFSGGEVPLNEQGVVEVSRIDWEGLAAFLERLLPLLLELLRILG